VFQLCFDCVSTVFRLCFDCVATVFEVCFWLCLLANLGGVVMRKWLATVSWHEMRNPSPPLSVSVLYRAIGCFSVLMLGHFTVALNPEMAERWRQKYWEFRAGESWYRSMFNRGSSKKNIKIFVRVLRVSLVFCVFAACFFCVRRLFAGYSFEKRWSGDNTSTLCADSGAEG
jgi:hypothetical protein